MKLSKELIVGLVVAIGITLLILGISYLKGLNPFKDKEVYYSVYPRVDGLVAANPVVYRGYKIGQVTDISLDKNNLNQYIVTFVIENKRIKIPKDSKVVIASDILGSRSLDLQLGESTTFTTSGDTLFSGVQSTLQEEVNQQLLPLKRKTEELIGSIDSMVQIVSGILNSENLSKLDESFDGVKNAILTFEKTAKRLDTLIAYEKHKISNIMTNMNEITTNLKNNNDNITNVITNFSSISDSLAAVDLTATLNNAKYAISSMTKVIDKVNNGEGSLGALLNSDTLINSLNATNDEVQRLIENVKEHPTRYLQFSIFGGKNKGMKLDARDEKKLKQFIRDSL